MDARVDERFYLHRRGRKVWREAAMLSRQSVEMTLERGGGFAKLQRWGWFSKASVQTFLKWNWTDVTLLPGGEVDQRDGDGIAGHQWVAAKAYGSVR